MMNDGTALVLDSIALGVATGGAFSLGDAALEFVAVSAGASASAARRLPPHPRDPPPDRRGPGRRPYPADRLRGVHRRRGVGVSWILAAVVAGLYGRDESLMRGVDGDTRLTGLPSGTCSTSILMMISLSCWGVVLPGIA